MKTMKRITATLLCIVSAACCFGCKEKETDAVLTSDNVIHEVEGTLHKINVTERNVSFVTNGQTAYEIYIDTTNPSLSAAINKSASFVCEQVEKLTDAELPIFNEKPEGLEESSKAIIYGYRDVMEAFGVSMPTDDIGNSGYYVKTVGNIVFIQANGSDGYRMGGLAFLRAALGYDMLSEDCVYFEKDGSKMPNIDIIEKPDFDYRQISNYYTTAEVYGMGMHAHTDIWIPVNGWDMHNTLYYVPTEIYGAEHPAWYREDKMQVCYTAHGQKGEYEALLQAVFGVVKTRMAECPTLENISFTAMDGTGQDSCYCEACTEYHDLYGTPAATCIYFMNDLNKLVQAHIQENEPGRVMNLTFFAYHDAEPAPVERAKRTDANGNVIWGEALTDANGNYIPLKRYARDEEGAFIKDANGEYVYETDENGNYVYLKCDKNVSPWLAPIYSKFTSSFYSEKNKTYAQNVALWYTVSEDVYVWLYGTNFCYYLFPYNTWSPVVETYRYLKECGVKYAWNQAQDKNESTAFAHLKDYIDSKFMLNVNADYKEVVDNYFERYYLEAAPYMQSMFNLEQAQSAYLEQTIPTISGGIYDDIGLAEYWPRLLIEEMLGMIDNAYKAVEKYKTTDVKLYNNLVRRIKQESIFPRYVQCMYYGAYYSNIYDLRKQFRDDWNELGFSIYRETGGDMQSVFTNDWGL